jgi:phosphatidylglycerophosphate synthase
VSKLNTALQICLAAVELARRGLGLDDFGVRTPLLYVVAVATVVSGGAYVIRWARDPVAAGPST